MVILWVEKDNGPEKHVWYCSLCTCFKGVFEGRQHIKADEYKMDHLCICYEIINAWRCVSCWDSSLYFSFTQTEEKQNYLNFMSNTLYFSSLELYSQISIVYSHLDLCSKTEQSAVKLFYLLLQVAWICSEHGYS